MRSFMLSWYISLLSIYQTLSWALDIRSKQSRALALRVQNRGKAGRGTVTDAGQRASGGVACGQRPQRSESRMAG